MFTYNILGRNIFMYPGRFYIPNNYMPRMAGGSAILGSLTKGIRNFNWSKLLTGANKTLNVMNQAIPLVKQAKPMINNVRSIMKIAKAFGSETNIKKNDTNNSTALTKKETDYPTFFA